MREGIVVNGIGRFASAPEFPEEPVPLLYALYGVGSYFVNDRRGDNISLTSQHDPQ